MTPPAGCLLLSVFGGGGAHQGLGSKQGGVKYCKWLFSLSHTVLLITYLLTLFSFHAYANDNQKNFQDLSGHPWTEIGMKNYRNVKKSKAHPKSNLSF